MNPKLLLILLIVTSWLIGCTATPQRSSPAPVVRSGTVAPGAERSARPEPGTEEQAGVGVYAYREASPAPARQTAQNPAVVALLSSADRQRETGDLNGAVATTERALRIEPRNPLLWHQLAALRLKQGQYPMAADLAAKSNALAGVDRDLKRRNWQLISRARQAMGDAAGARQAETKMREF